MSNNDALVMAMKVSQLEVALRRASLQIETLEAQLALTKVMYARDLRLINAAMPSLDAIQAIVNNRLNDESTEIDITDDDVVDAIRNFDSKTGSKGAAE